MPPKPAVRIQNWFRPNAFRADVGFRCVVEDPAGLPDPEN